MVYVKQQRYMTCQFLTQTQKREVFCTLRCRGDNLNELIHQCDASMSLIKKYGAVSARPKPPQQNNANKQF